MWYTIFRMKTILKLKSNAFKILLKTITRTGNGNDYDILYTIVKQSSVVLRLVYINKK